MNKFFQSRTFFLLNILFLFCQGAYAQDEYLTPLMHNQVIKNYLSGNRQVNALKSSSAGPDTLTLPFYDDFSAPGIYPDQAIWTDSNVFINGTFSETTPTVGMATFDGLDKFGNPYNNSALGTYGLTDKLESKPINLFEDNNGNQYTSSDSITLSFYYQRRGLGDVPEYGDSLQLEFYDVDSQTWIWQWSKDGGTFDFNFIRVFIKITDPQFFDKGFRFRFRSYGSQTGSLDNWNLDYVILRKPFFPNDILVNDIGYQLPAHSILNVYTAIPYDHYKFIGGPGQTFLMKSTDQLSVFNLFNTASAPSQANFRIFEESAVPPGLQFQYVTSGNGNIVIPANSNINYSYPNPPLNYKFPDTIPGNFASFQLVDNLASPNQDYNKNNDTIRYRQVFDNYYAYDDGSSEAGYSLINAPGGKLAYKFNLLKPDIIRGMYIHWNQMYADVSLKLFKMVIWQSLTPEVIRYQEINQKPLYYDSINGFRYYEFDSIINLPAGDFYIGLVQSAADALYLGFDRNTDANSKMWYNTTGTWTQSSIPGAFMFRPAFGDSVLLAGVVDKAETTVSFSLFPNPAANEVKVMSDMKSPEDIYFDIVDVSGRAVKPFSVLSPSIDISMLVEGFYVVRFYNKQHKVLSSRKLMVIRQ